MDHLTLADTEKHLEPCCLEVVPTLKFGVGGVGWIAINSVVFTPIRYTKIAIHPPFPTSSLKSWEHAWLVHFPPFILFVHLAQLGHGKAWRINDLLNFFYSKIKGDLNEISISQVPQDAWLSDSFLLVVQGAQKNRKFSSRKIFPGGRTIQEGGTRNWTTKALESAQALNSRFFRLDVYF